MMDLSVAKMYRGNKADVEEVKLQTDTKCGVESEISPDPLDDDVRRCTAALGFTRFIQ